LNLAPPANAKNENPNQRLSDNPKTEPLMEKLLPVFLGLFSTIAFFAFRPVDATVEVEGRVLFKEKALPSVIVSVEKEESEVSPHRYYEPTTQNGQYRLKFNIREGAPFNLLFEKPGYYPHRLQVTLSGAEGVKRMADVELVRMTDSPGSSTSSLTHLRSLQVHPIQDEEEFAYFQPYDIDYFAFVERREFIPATRSHWYRVRFRLRDGRFINGFIVQ
jgi:hypothetical protein